MTSANGTLTNGHGTDRASPEEGAAPAGLPVAAPRALPFSGLDRGAAREFEPRVARMEQELEAARCQGLVGLLRLRYEAWLEERMRGPAIQKMQARQAILEEQKKTAEAEIRLRATVQSGEVGAQRQKIEWNQVNRQRLAGELQSLGLITLAPAPADGPPAASLPVPSLPVPSRPALPPVAPHVTDEQIEAVALRGFLQGVETDEDWEGYKGELARHLSPYAVEEVGQRLRDLWRLNRQAQGAEYGQAQGAEYGRAL